MQIHVSMRCVVKRLYCIFESRNVQNRKVCAKFKDVSRTFKRLCSNSFKVLLVQVKPLSHWTATVLRQLATDIASGSQSSLETVASDS